MQPTFSEVTAQVLPYFREIRQDSSAMEVWQSVSKVAEMFKHSPPGVMALAYTACAVTLERRGKVMSDHFDYLFFAQYGKEWMDGEEGEGEGSSLREGASPITYESHRRRLQEEPLRDEGWYFGGRYSGELDTRGEAPRFSIRRGGEEKEQGESG